MSAAFQVQTKLDELHKNVCWGPYVIKIKMISLILRSLNERYLNQEFLGVKHPATVQTNDT